MVAIISGGNGGRLGLEQSSAFVLGSKGQLGSAGLGRAGDNVYVNAASGNLVVSATDEVLIGRGPDDAIGRTYNSLGDLSDDNGDNWRLSASRKVAGLTGTVNTSGSTVTRTDWDGSKVIYTYQTSGTYSGKYLSTEGDGAHDTLSYASNVWTWTNGSSRVVESYDNTNGGRITSSADTDGNALSFTYNGSGLVSRVTTAGGDYTDLVYSGTLLTQVETRNSSGTLLLTRTRYTYDGSNRLSTVTVDLTPTDNSIANNVKYVTTYGYDGTSGKVNAITQTDGSSLAIGYTLVGSDYRVSSLTQTSSSGVTRVTTMSYNTTTRVTTITDPDSKVTTLEYDTAGRLTRVLEPEAASVGTIGGANGFIATAQNTETWVYQGGAYTSTNIADVMTFTVTLQAVGSLTYVDLGVSGSSGWGPNGSCTASIVSGSGSLAQINGGQWRISGLSTSAPTTVTITRTMTYASDTAGVVQVGPTGGDVPGEAVIISDPIYRKNGGANLWPHPDDSTYWATLGSAVVVSRAFLYDADGNLATVVMGPNNAVSYTYDANGNVTLERDWAGNTVSYTYGSNNELLTKTVYRTPDPDGAGGSSASDGATTRYAYDSENHLRFTITPEGRVTEYYYNAYGQVTYAYEFTGDLYTTSGAASHSTMASWATGKYAASRLVESTYDYRGNLATTTTYTAVQSSSLGDTAKTYTTTTYTYDQAGNLLQRQVSGVSGSEVFTYDGLGRMLTAEDFSTNVTTTIYNDATSTTTISFVNGLTKTSVYNLAGELVSYAKSGTGVTTGTATYTYDAHGRVRVAADELGNKTYFLYDRIGRRVGEVSALGALTEFKYDANDRLIARVRYATLLSSGTLSSLDSGTPTSYVAISSIRPSAASADQWAWNVYDDAGRLIRTIDGTGAVTTFEYNGASQLIKTTAYATLLSSGTVSGYKATPPRTLTTPSTSGDDRVTRFFYDADGRQIGALDAVGALTESVYDGAGQKVKTIAYATATNSANRASGSFATLKSDVTGATNPNDVHNWFVYDSRGLLCATVDGEGDIVRYTYSNAGNLTQSVAGQQGTVSSFISTRPLLSTLPSVPGGTLLVTTSYTYDALGQMLTASGDAVTITNGATLATTSSQTPTTTNQYDTVGQLIKSTAPDGGATYYWYDQRGRKIAEANPAGTLYTWTYDVAGNVTSAKAYDTALTGTITAGGTPPSGSGTYRETTYAYDAENRLTTTTVASLFTGEYTSSWATTTSSVSTTTYYDAFGRTVKSTDGQGNSVYAFYDVDNRLVATADREKFLTSYSYNAFDQTTKTEAFSTAVSSVSETSDPASLRSSVSSGSGNRVTNLAYDKAGRLVSQTREAVVQTTLSSVGAPTTTTADAATAYQYDLLGRLTRTTEAASTTGASETSATFSVTGGGSLWSTYGHTVSGALSDGITNTYASVIGLSGGAVVADLGSVQTVDRIEVLPIHSSLDGWGPTYLNGCTVEYSTDGTTWIGGGTVSGATNSAAAVVSLGVSARYIRVNANAGYVAIGDLRVFSFEGGIATDFAYDRAGRLTSSVGPAFTDYTGATVKTGLYTTYNGLGQVASTTLRSSAGTNSADRVTTYAYGAGGRLASLTDAEGHVTTYGYDIAGRRTAAQYTRSGATEATATAYDVMGRVVREGKAAYASSTWTFGDYSNASYNAHGELTVKGVNGMSQETFAYDAGGRLWKTNAGDGTWKIYVHDKAGNVSLTVTSAGQQLGGAGTYADLASVSQSSAAAAGSSAVSGMVATINVRDKRGLVTQVREPNRELSASSSNNLIVHDQTYNAFGEMATLRVANSSSADDDTIYSYNTLGKLIKKEMPKVAWTEEDGDVHTGVRPTEEYLYDVAGRYIGIKDANAQVGTAYYSTWKLDGAGRVVKEFHADGGTAETKYDVYGNVRKSVDELGEIETRNYDELGRVTSIENVTRTAASNGNPGSALTLINYFEYDSLGQLTAHWNSQFGSGDKERE